MKTVQSGILVILLLGLSFPMRAEAEFYRYVDPHGNVIYTDDLSKIPVDKRPQAKMYDDSQTQAPAVPVETQAAEPKPSPLAGEMEAIRKEGQRLETVQAGLSREYDDLVKENATLKAEQKEAVTPDQIKAVNKKVVSFNARFKAYQEKEAAYNTELEAYHQRVEAAESTNPKTNKLTTDS